jgi:ABC-type transport system involved in cytochrome c biogenesis permease subunit
VYFVVEHLIHLKVYGAVLVPLALLLLLIAQLMGAGNVAAALPPAEAALLESWRVGVHVALIVLANAGFAIGAAASIAYLALEAQLKGHRTATLFRRLPSLAQTDFVARRAIAWSFPAYSVGLLLGVLRAIETDIAGWWADPRVMLSGVVWVIFAVYLYLRYGRGVSGRTTAYIAIVGLVFVVALSVAARLVPVGFHVFGVAGR